MQQLQTHPGAGIRQIAAVLLRRKIATHFRKQSEAAQTTIKQSLLDRLVNEEKRAVRLSVAALISALGAKLVPANKWNELLQFLLQCSESQQAGHREVAMVLFRALADGIGESLKPHFAVFQQIFVKGLSDPEKTVRHEALRALGVLAEEFTTDEEVARFSEAIPHMVEAVKRSIQEGNEEGAAIAFEAFDNLAESPFPVIVPHIPIILALMADVTANPQMDMNIRDKASLFIASMCEGKPGKLVKGGLVAPLIDMCFKLAMEHNDDFDETQEINPQKIAVEIMDGLALNTPKQFVYDNCVQRLMAHLNDGANPLARKGALVILAVLAEGLGDLFKPNLVDLVQLIIKSMQDPVAMVRSAAAMTLKQFSDFLQPEIIDCHQMVMPALFACLDSATEDAGVKKRACSALDSFCEKLDREIQPYISPLMTHLVTTLRTSKDKQTQEGAISAIKSIAKSADEAFSPFFHDTVIILGELMTQKEDEMLGLRSEATECMGAIACAVGKEKFASFLPDSIKLAIEGMTLDHFQLREATHNFFQSLCMMLGPDFHQLLGTVMPLLLASLASDDGLVVSGGDEDNMFGGGAAGFDDSGDDEDDEGDEGDDGKRLRFMIRSGALDEKLAAVICLGTVASVVGEKFMPYLEKTLDNLEELVCYPHHYVRAAVLQTIQEISGMLNQIYPNQAQWTAGQAVPMHQHTQTVMTRVIPVFIDRMKAEDDKGVAAAACAALFDACKKFGPACIASDIDEIYEAVLELVQEKAPCQMAYDDDDPEKEDHDEVLIDDVTNVIGVLAQMVGPSFDPVFQQIFPALLKFCPAHRPATDRSMAIGCIAEIAEAMGNRINPYLDQVFPMTIAGLADPSVGVRRNSAFCMRCLCGAVGEPLYQYYPQCLTALQPLLVIPDNISKYEKEQIVATKDNALSVIAEMLKVKAAAVPVDQVVPALLAGCPLTADFEEAKHVYPCIINLFNTHPQLMMTNLGPAVNAIAGALEAADMLEDETKAQLVQFCKHLPQAAGGPVLEGVLNQLPPARKEVFMLAVNS